MIFLNVLCASTECHKVQTDKGSPQPPKHMNFQRFSKLHMTTTYAEQYPHVVCVCARGTLCYHT